MTYPSAPISDADSGVRFDSVSVVVSRGVRYRTNPTDAVPRGAPSGSPSEPSGGYEEDQVPPVAASRGRLCDQRRTLDRIPMRQDNDRLESETPWLPPTVRHGTNL